MIATLRPCQREQAEAKSSYEETNFSATRNNSRKSIKRLGRSAESSQTQTRGIDAVMLVKYSRFVVRLLFLGTRNTFRQKGDSDLKNVLVLCSVL